MHTNALVSTLSLSETVRRLVGLTLVAMATITGCHDAPTGPLAPAKPTLAVSTDGAWLVNSLADPGDGVCANNECTLREAIAAAQNGDRITFKSNLSGTIALSGSPLVIEVKSLTIEGPGADALVVSGQNASRVFQIGNAVDSNVVVMSGLTITGGKASGQGGGILVHRAARLVLVASLITGNSVSQDGGGIYSEGTLTVAGSTIADNEASSGGGGIFTPDGRLTVIRSTISLNTAGGSSEGGGGVFTGCQTAWCGASTIRSTTITRNEAGTLGGGLAVESNDVTVFNTIIAGNQSPLPQEVECSGAFNLIISLGHNLSTLDTGCKLTASTDVNLALASQVFMDVIAFPLTNNGGRVPTHALIERGLAVDAGYCPGENADVRGFPRPYDDVRVSNALDGCDMGAFEWNPAPTKNNGSKP